MREIKFRAWDKEESEMLQDSESKFYLTQGLEADFMQYTGLKDKNGKEIYEGDILRDGDGDLYLVKWLNASFIIEHIGIDVYSDLFGWSNWKHGKSRTFEADEVIGNIYENPELLNK